jgi:hypothetical protein
MSANPFFDRFTAWLHRTHPEVVLTDYQTEVARQMLAHSSITAITSRSRKHGGSLVVRLLADYANGSTGPELY